jgi:hypothetical protein
MLLVKIGLIEINHKLLEKNRFKEERRSKKKIRAAKRLVELSLSFINIIHDRLNK